MQYVIEFGSDNADSLLDCILASVGSPTSIEVSTPDLDGPTYRQVDEELVSVMNGLRRGTLNSIVLRFRAPSVRYAMITGPCFLGQQLTTWMATIESTEPHWKNIWNALLARHDLRFVCVGLEEGIDLTDMVLDADLFPWGIPPAIISALKRSDGSWLIRESNATSEA